MESTLNITNGDSAVEIMKKANLPGTFLPWRDVLHDGPVPKEKTLEQLSQVRAEFIASRGWGERETIENDFIARDNVLKSFEQYEKIILWFEHDLYDQLQILQILDWFYNNTKSVSNLSIICTDHYLGLQSPDEMAALIKYEESVTEAHLTLSSRAWSAFRSGSPQQWNELLNTDTSVLPFLEGAIIRQLEEYPSVVTGLSRTAEQALQYISKCEQTAGKVFANNQEVEERIFMGDSSFWVILQGMLDSEPALIKSSEAGVKLSYATAKSSVLSITAAGLEVLSGKRNWLDIVELDCWVGGVHLVPNHIWCWNSSVSKIELKVPGSLEGA